MSTEETREQTVIPHIYWDALFEYLSLAKLFELADSTISTDG
jgi:hypothetical protein